MKKPPKFEISHLPDLIGHYRLANDKIIYLNPEKSSGYFNYLEGYRLVHLDIVSPTLLRSEKDEVIEIVSDPAGVIGLNFRVGSECFFASRLNLYETQEVEFFSGSTRLSGTLMLADRSGLGPAVVLVQGAGSQTRDFNRLIADHFVRRGITALVYDKPGCGASEGNWQNGNYTDLAAVTLAGLDYVRKQPGVDPTQVGLYGFSEGAWVVGLAARSKEVAFVIFVGGSGTSPAEQEKDYRQYRYKQENLPGFIQNVRLKMWDLLNVYCRLAKRFPILAFNGSLKFFSHTLDYDPLPTLAGLSQPILAIWGELDRNVGAEKSRRIFEQILQSNQHSNYQLQIFPEGNHILFRATTGNMGKEVLPIVEFVPDYLDTMCDWIIATTVN